MPRKRDNNNKKKTEEKNTWYTHYTAGTQQTAVLLLRSNRNKSLTSMILVLLIIVVPEHQGVLFSHHTLHILQVLYTNCGYRVIPGTAAVVLEITSATGRASAGSTDRATGRATARDRRKATREAHQHSVVSTGRRRDDRRSRQSYVYQ